MFRKFRNKKIEKYGLKFDSLGECKRYEELLKLQEAGMIKNLQHHPDPFILLEKNDKFRAVTYQPDFFYTENNICIFEDFKGMQTDVFKLKQKMLYALRGIEIRITGRKK